MPLTVAADGPPCPPPIALPRLPACDTDTARIAPTKARISAARRGGTMRTTSMTSSADNPLAASASPTIATSTRG